MTYVGAVVGRELTHGQAVEYSRRRLVDGRLRPEESAALRRHLNSCESCRRAYGELAVNLRVAAGLDETTPTGLESRLLMEETLAGLGLTSAAAPAPGRARAPGWLRTLGWALAPVAAAALVLFALLPVGETPEPPFPSGDDRLHSRGAGEELPVAGLGLSGVDSEGREYEVVEGDGLCLADALRFYVRSRKKELSHYFLFGLQQGTGPIWYFPSPEEGESLRLSGGTDGPVMVPWEIEVGRRHRPGRLAVVLMLSERPLWLETVAGKLALRQWREDGWEESAIERDLSGKMGPGVVVTAEIIAVKACEVEE